MTELEQLPVPSEPVDDPITFRPEPLEGERLRFYTGFGRLDSTGDSKGLSRNSNFVFGSAMAVIAFGGRRLPYQIGWTLEQLESSPVWNVRGISAQRADSTGATYFPAFEFGRLTSTRDNHESAISHQAAVNVTVYGSREKVLRSIAADLTDIERHAKWHDLVWGVLEELTYAAAAEGESVCPSLTGLWIERSRFDARAIFMRAPFFFDDALKPTGPIRPIDWSEVPLNDPRRLRLEAFADNRRPVWRYDSELGASQLWHRGRPLNLWEPGNSKTWQFSNAPSWLRAFDVAGPIR